MNSMVKGWCPGALRPMLTGDGWLVRVRPMCGRITAPQALDLADCAEKFGNGLMELTSRANLQLRGVRIEMLAALQARLKDISLLDDDAASEAVRNIIASPLAGLDPAAALDIRPMVAALGARLASDAALYGLPGKFGFVVGDGGQFALAEVEGDIRFLAQADQTFAIWLGGLDRPVGSCTPAEVPDVAAGLATAFIAARGTGPHAPRRMRQLASKSALWDHAFGRRVQGLPPEPHSSAKMTGMGSLAAGGPGFISIGKAFGRWTAGEWRGLAQACQAHAGPMAELRLTHWRHVLMPVADPVEAQGLRVKITAFGGILDAGDVRLAVAACPGAPACSHATTPTQADALALAALATERHADGIGLHVSGCAKGCARAASTPITLVARHGLYDLVFDGTPGDAATFRGLTPAMVAQALRNRATGKQPAESLV